MWLLLVMRAPSRPQPPEIQMLPARGSRTGSTRVTARRAGHVRSPCFTHLPSNSPHWDMLPPTLLCPGRSVVAAWTAFCKVLLPWGQAVGGHGVWGVSWCFVLWGCWRCCEEERKPRGGKQRCPVIQTPSPHSPEVNYGEGTPSLRLAQSRCKNQCIPTMDHFPVLKRMYKQQPRGKSQNNYAE